MPQFSLVTQSCMTLCNPMDCSMPGLPVHHQLLKLAQTHAHQVCNAILPFHPLSSPSPPAGVQPQWIQGDSKVGTELASLEITYLVINREGLEN